MNAAIYSFENALESRMSHEYYDELHYFSSLSCSVPNPVININDVLLLKRGQQYIHHTERVLHISLAELLHDLFAQIGCESKIAKADGGKSRVVFVTVKNVNYRIHFLGQESFVGFPKVPWMDTMIKNSGDGRIDLYSVLIVSDELGKNFLAQANIIMHDRNISTKRFISFEDAISMFFGAAVWKEVQECFGRIEKVSKQYQWFGLINYYNDLTKADFIGSIANNLKSEDYMRAIQRCGSTVSSSDFSVLYERYVIHKKYEYLLGTNDFCESFITSEWLFSNLSDISTPEKTFIVTGYLKSIEQILSYVIRRTSSYGASIGINTSRGIVDVDITSDDFFKATLGNMQYYLKSYSNRNIYDARLSKAYLFTMNAIMNDWIQKERNGYFHKHNVGDSNKVNEIREKTLLLYFLILGATKDFKDNK